LPTTDPERGALIELGVPELQPDQDLLDLEHHGGPHVDAPRDVARTVDDMLGRLAIGLGVAQWHGKDSDNDSAWGVDVVVGSQKSYGYKRFWSRELAASVGIRAPVATSIEGLFRLGAGLRSTGVGLTAYGVGGVSRRGDSGDFDLGLPIGIEAGAGGKLTLGSGHARRVEVLGEQLWRLGADAGAVDARLRFELRYVRARPADTGYGVRGWCAFEKVAGTTAIRTCTLAGELGF
jgi:hypothetical protein